MEVGFSLRISVTGSWVSAMTWITDDQGSLPLWLTFSVRGGPCV